MNQILVLLESFLQTKFPISPGSSLMACGDLTVEHGEPLQVLVRLHLLGGTQRHTQSHGLDLPLDDVYVTGVQEEDKPADREHRKEVT